jgi:hypothetical protein
VTIHIDPIAEQLAGFASGEPTTPMVMLDLNRYRARAHDDDPGPDDDVSGRGAYLRDGEVAQRAMAAVGAQVLWMAPAEQVLVRGDHDIYDEALLVWYPSRAAFLQRVSLDWYREALVHPTAALEHASIIALTGPATPTFVPSTA